MKDYCYLSTVGFGECLPAKKSHIKFIGFLLTHPSVNAMSYMLPYLPYLGIIIGFLTYLYKRKEIKIFFKPNKFNIIFTLILGLFTPFFLTVLIIGKEQFIGWVIGHYLITSLIKYVYTRIKKK